jgi:Uncharacterized ACR, YhhQ family COG1738.
MKFTGLYLASIVAVNFAFSYLPMIQLPLDQAIPVGTLLVGFIFVLRDYAQREIGLRIYLAMLLGVIVSYVMADPFVAVASAVAFGVSELVDALIFTVTKKPMRERILISSAASTPIDSAIFLLMIGVFNWFGFLVMVIVKMFAALVVWRILR